MFSAVQIRLGTCFQQCRLGWHMFSAVQIRLGTCFQQCRLGWAHVFSSAEARHRLD